MRQVCDIDERTARELLVRESWDHQKILELQWPSEGICTAASSTLNCPVCLESCTVGSSNGTQFFELCDHPMHTQCARDFIENEINLVRSPSGINLPVDGIKTCLQYFKGLECASDVLYYKPIFFFWCRWLG